MGRYPFLARGVAQPGSALRSGRRGPQFKSGHPDRHGGTRGSPTATPPSVFGSGFCVTPPGRRRPPARLLRPTELGVRLKPDLGVRFSRRAYPAFVLRAVLFDVDFTLFRPGPELGPEGYRRVGERHGLELDPGRYAKRARTRSPRSSATGSSCTTKRSGSPSPSRSSAAWAGTARLRARARSRSSGSGSGTRTSCCSRTRCRCSATCGPGLKIGLVSNGARDLEEFAAHHALEVDATVGSSSHGRIKPDPSIFVAALGALESTAEETAMVGDSFEDDIEGARALGMRAILLDREG